MNGSERKFQIDQHSKWVVPVEPFIELSHPCHRCGETMTETLKDELEPNYKQEDATFTVYFFCETCDPDYDDPLEVEYKIKSVIMTIEKVEDNV